MKHQHDDVPFLPELSSIINSGGGGGGGGVLFFSFSILVFQNILTSLLSMIQCRQNFITGLQEVQ